MFLWELYLYLVQSVPCDGPPGALEDTRAYKGKGGGSGSSLATVQSPPPGAPWGGPTAFISKLGAMRGISARNRRKRGKLLHFHKWKPRSLLDKAHWWQKENSGTPLSLRFSLAVSNFIPRPLLPRGFRRMVPACKGMDSCSLGRC